MNADQDKTPEDRLKLGVSPEDDEIEYSSGCFICQSSGEHADWCDKHESNCIIAR